MMAAKFQPIEGSAQSWDRYSLDGIRVLDQTKTDAITDLLMGRRVTKVDGEHIVLDNGTTIKAIGRDGGCSCNAGCYDLAVLNGTDNIITRVEFDYAPAAHDIERPRRYGHPDDPAEEWVGYYRVFVFADNQQINLMQFNGTDGNGYYGTGFEILVRDVKEA